MKLNDSTFSVITDSYELLYIFIELPTFVTSESHGSVYYQGLTKSFVSQNRRYLNRQEIANALVAPLMLRMAAPILYPQEIRLLICQPIPKKETLLHYYYNTK